MDRIVSFLKTNVLSFLRAALVAAGKTITNLTATAPGVFSVTASISTDYGLATEPLKKLNFGSSATAGTVVFIPAYDFDGFYLNGVYEEPADGSDDVDANGTDIYKAVLSSGDITITKLSL